MYCPDCGSQAVEGRRFCTNCGSDLGALPVSTPAGSIGGRTPASESRAPTPAGGSTPGGSLGEWATSLPTSDIAAFQPGEVVGRRFEVRSLLGKGGMGAVYRVFDRSSGRRCAFKVMHPHLLGNAKAVERFLEEARLSRRLQHPHIVRVHDIAEFGDWYGCRWSCWTARACGPGWTE